MAENTNFKFQHKVFSAPGAVFRLDRVRGEVSMYVDLGGEVTASVPLRSLVATFQLDRDSDDARLLLDVERGLRFVREIRPGDSIPSEIVDGTASWTVEDRHREMTQTRLTRQLVRWLIGTGAAAGVAVEDFDAMLQSEEARSMVNRAFAEAATYLELGEDGREKVVQMLEQLAGEMSYIEALRERLSGALAIPRRLRSLGALYKRERSLQETLHRTMLLMERPIAEIRQAFDLLDAQTSEVMSALRNLQSTIAFIRTERDRLRDRVLLWDEVIDVWRDVPMERTDRTDRLIKDLNRFVVTHFPMEQRWALEV